MHLRSIQLINYKNFESKSIDFDSNINCIVGNNGVGKTNVLDAIYHLSQTKSYFNPISIQNVRHGEEFFMLEGLFLNDNKEETIVCSYQKSKKKVIKRNGKSYERFSDHIGSIPLVIISPTDSDLIIEGSQMRRKFMDSVISQSDKQYLHNVIAYNKVLSQRNALLKYFAKNRTFDLKTLLIYNKQLIDYANQIHETRNDFVTRLKPIFLKHYKAISNAEEKVNLIYASHLNENSLDILLEQTLGRDKVLQYTSKGVHRDDLNFEIDDFPIKKFGSQGQQKSFLIALKLAQFDIIRDQIKSTPILLLDDIFDKLDDQRVSKLVKMVKNNHFGQIFISDTHFERTELVVKNTNQSYKMIQL